MFIQNTSPGTGLWKLLTLLSPLHERSALSATCSSPEFSVSSPEPVILQGVSGQLSSMYLELSACQAGMSPPLSYTGGVGLPLKQERPSHKNQRVTWLVPLWLGLHTAQQLTTLPSTAWRKGEADLKRGLHSSHCLRIDPDSWTVAILFFVLLWPALLMLG